MLIRFGIAGVLLGCALAYFGWQEWHLASGASEQPETITLEALIKRGPEGNTHIILDEFIGCLNFVYETRKRSDSYAKVWVPVVPLPRDEEKIDPEKLLKPTNVKCILITEHASNQDQLGKILDKDKLQGMVTNKVRSLGSDERSKLKSSYPDTDFDQCIIFEEGRQPSGTGKVLGMAGGGLALVLIGGVLAIAGFRK